MIPTLLMLAFAIFTLATIDVDLDSPGMFQPWKV